MTTHAPMTYALHDHVQCRVHDNLFTGVIYLLDLKERAYHVHAELPQGIVPLKVTEAEMVQKLGVWKTQESSLEHIYSAEGERV